MEREPKTFAQRTSCPTPTHTKPETDRSANRLGMNRLRTTTANCNAKSKRQGHMVEFLCPHSRRKISSDRADSSVRNSFPPPFTRTRWGTRRTHGLPASALRAGHALRSQSPCSNPRVYGVRPRLIYPQANRRHGERTQETEPKTAAAKRQRNKQDAAVNRSKKSPRLSFSTC